MNGSNTQLVMLWKFQTLVNVDGRQSKVEWCATHGTLHYTIVPTIRENGSLHFQLEVSGEDPDRDMSVVIDVINSVVGKATEDYNASLEAAQTIAERIAAKYEDLLLASSK